MTDLAEREIRDLIERRLAAMRAKDVQAVIGFGTDDFTYFSLAPPLVDRSEPAELARWFASWEDGLAFEIRDLVVVAGETAAFAHGVANMRGTQSGAAVDLWFRQTLGFQKIHGAWKLSHAHDSVPFEMDGSFRAAIDLKP